MIEVDGGYHQLTKEQDDFRTSVLNSKGFEVIRFTNEEVLKKLEMVLASITETLILQPDRSLTQAVSKAEEDEKVLSFGEDLGEATIEVFTTRVDTIFGVTFIVLAPEHELVPALTTTGQQAEIDAYIAQTKKKSELDRMAEAKVVSGAFTGSFVLNPLNGEKCRSGLPITFWQLWHRRGNGRTIGRPARLPVCQTIRLTDSAHYGYPEY